MPTPTYIGESSRTTYTRGIEHQEGYTKKRETSFMWRHCKEKHGGQIDSPQRDYTYSVLESHRDCLNRVLGEAVNIQAMVANPKMNSMNSRQEYFTPQYVRPVFSKGPGD